jgi:peptidylprolyl isomerase
LGVSFDFQNRRCHDLAIKNGDFVLIDYTLKVKETGEIVGTTYEKVAKESKLYRGEEHYEPYFVIVGEGWVPKGLDEGLATLDTGKSSTIELPAEKAYGARDPKKVRLVPLRKFTADGVTPTPGAQLNIDGKPAQIRAVGAGRVQVDYNHPLAGRTLIYDVTVQKIIDVDEEKIRTLLHKRLATVSAEKFLVTIDNGKLEVEMPEDAFFLEGLQVEKRTITADITKFLPKIDTVSFVEIFKKPATPAPAEAKPVSEAQPPAAAATPTVQST